MKSPRKVEAAEIVLPCTDLKETLPFYLDRLGFRLDAIYPADDPAVAVVSGHGLRLRLDEGARGAPGRLRLLCSDARPAGGEASAEITAPNGTVVEFADSDPPLAVPPGEHSLVVTRLSGGDGWHVGRAGMQYRDLVPDRQGGRFIASHIRIPEGGPVPDNVHFHKIRFQMIFCYRGWVRLVYEDQGEPFVMKAGDCVLQPPEIRHRVLESSDGLEVVEIGCPAEHMTLLDHRLDLPTGRHEPGRDFGGQRFVFHQADKAEWRPWRAEGFEARDTGIGEATGGLAGARVVRAAGAGETPLCRHDGEFLFAFVLAGGATLKADDQTGAPLAAGDCFVMPAGMAHALTGCSGDLEFLEVTLPADLPVGG